MGGPYYRNDVFSGPARGRGGACLVRASVRSRRARCHSRRVDLADAVRARALRPVPCTGRSADVPARTRHGARGRRRGARRRAGRVAMAGRLARTSRNRGAAYGAAVQPRPQRGVGDLRARLGSAGRRRRRGLESSARRSRRRASGTARLPKSRTSSGAARAGTIGSCTTGRSRRRISRRAESASRCAWSTSISASTAPVWPSRSAIPWRARIAAGSSILRSPPVTTCWRSPSRPRMGCARASRSRA